MDDTRAESGNTVSKFKPIKYAYPEAFISGETSNADLFLPVMGGYIDKVMEGYNVNFMAYGQTGSGKTYTLIGEKGSFTTAAETPNECPHNWGLFPRTALEILNRIQGKTNQKLICTINEFNMWDPRDLVENRNIWMDTNDILVGHSTHEIASG